MSRRITFASWRDLAHPQAGGSELLVDQLARACVERGDSVELMCAAPTSPRPYRVVPLGGDYGQYLRAPFAYARGNGADVLVDVENGIPFFSPLWRRGPVVCLVHHVHGEQWRMRFPAPIAALGRVLEERVMPKVYRRAIFLCVSPSTATALSGLGVSEELIRVLPMGADLASGQAAGKSPTPMFVALGRLAPHKRLDLLARVWARVRERVGGRLVIAGDGPERKRLQRLGGEGIEIVGKVSEDEKRHLLQSAWLLVHPAAHEGWGIVITEAAAQGTPSLAFDVPGVRDAVRPGRTGILAGSEEEFASQWVALASDPGRRSRMGAAARAQVAEMPWSATVDEFMAAVDDAARLHANGRAVTA
jgi:glycosyltransferase involved in cell wall biosynthesis